MRVGGIAAAAVVAVFLVSTAGPVAHGQAQPPSETLLITTARAATWTDGAINIVQIETPVTIETDRARMTADRAVIWLTPVDGDVFDQERAEIALIGNAKLTQGAVEREGERLFVRLVVRGTIRITADERAAQNRSDSELYRAARSLRPRDANAPAPADAIDQPEVNALPPWLPPPPAPAAPTTRPGVAPNVRPTEPVSFRAGDVQTTRSSDGNLTLVLSGDVVLFQSRASGDFIELQAGRAVLFTPVKNLRDIGEDRQIQRIEDAVTAAYLDGDVRITFTPRERRQAEQRLRAQRVYYEFTTDRAVLTDAVIHTIEPQRQIPVIVRADIIRQLSVGEYRASDVELSTSGFAVPSYSLAADRAYVRTYETGDPRFGQRTEFSARDATFQLFDVPFFWLPVATGAITERGAALRQIAVESSSRFGPSIRTDWGLFETLGLLPPRGLDVGYELDYLGKRGPAFGLNADYHGGFITETTKDPWNFIGNFDSYFVLDHGNDRLGRERLVIEPEKEFRGHALWEHQHFFPEDWQVQLRAGWASDPTFLEQYFQSEFNDGLPHNISAYLKRQRQSEAFTLLFEFQPLDFVTTSESLQEQFEVERLPEIGYHRIGQSLWDDQLTFTSNNTIGGLKFAESDYTLAEQGFRGTQSPGLPSVGTTGTTDDTIFRGDFRQEIAYPLNAGQFRVLPYVMGRYVPYSDSPDEGTVNRAIAGAGVRMSTAFWKTDDTAQSRLFDIHRLRHVIEPELHVFTSVQSKDQTDVFVFDEDVDRINDISAVQLALRQRWQTKRGGAGRWRSVDFLTFNVEGNFFANQPDDDLLAPEGFRGLFFPSVPEASIPRNSINADGLWRVSDTFALLADQSYNLDEMQLATTSVGLAVSPDPRVRYFLGARYIGQINSTIASLAINYELSPKYSIQFIESVNLSERQNQDTSFTIIRRFDRFFLTFTMYYDAVDDVSGVRFGLVPQGLGTGITTDQFNTAFGAQ